MTELRHRPRVVVRCSCCRWQGKRVHPSARGPVGCPECGSEVRLAEPPPERTPRQRVTVHHDPAVLARLGPPSSWCVRIRDAVRVAVESGRPSCVGPIVRSRSRAPLQRVTVHHDPAVLEQLGPPTTWRRRIREAVRVAAELVDRSGDSATEPSTRAAETAESRGSLTS
jgi:hypothetical protein